MTPSSLPSLRLLIVDDDDQLRPGGILVVNFFGPRDSWAGRDGMRFIDADAVRELVDGLELLALDEEDQDGNSFLGPKHWHVFDVIARRSPGPHR